MTIRILALGKAGGGLASTAVRGIWPLVALNRLDDFQCNWVQAKDIAEAHLTEEFEPLSGYDIYLLLRSHTTWEYEGTPFDTFVGPDAALVYDTDDDLTGRYRDFGKQGGLHDTLAYFDAITCTNDHLAGIMSDFGKPVYVVPNALDTLWYEKSSLRTERKDPRLSIGLLGTDTHFFDWLEVREALEYVREHYPDVLVMCGGFRPVYLEGVVEDFYGGVPFMIYPSLLRQVDIRLCPLENEESEPFNLSKSPIAALEAMAAARPVGNRTGGCIPVCSDHPVYRECVRHKQNGLIVRDNWTETLCKLIEDERYRQNLAVAGHRWVMAHGDVQSTADRWAEVFRTIVEVKRGNQDEAQEEVDPGSQQEDQEEGDGRLVQELVH